MPKLPPKDYIQAVDFPTSVSLTPIGMVRSPYTERHGTPRQSQLCNQPQNYQPASATVELFEEVVPAIALKDLEGFDWIWVIAWLHLNKNWNPTVLPPPAARACDGEPWRHAPPIAPTPSALARSGC